MIEIKRATLSDIESLTSLFDQYRVFYLQDPKPNEAETFLENRIINDDSAILIAKKNDIAIGFAQLYPSFSSVSMRQLWILNDLFVEPAHRKQNVAKSLIAAAESLARASGSIGLTLKTSRDNESAQALYEKLGWKRDEQFVSYNLRFK